MSFDLVEAVRRTGLESGARRSVLEALAFYTDDETGLARASRASIAMRAAVSDKTVQRLLRELVEDATLEGLVRVVKPAAGRGNPAVYAVDLARLAYVSDAVKLAQRKCRAGVAKALLDRNLVGAKATADTIGSVFSAIIRLLTMERYEAEAEAVRGLWEACEAHMSATPRPEIIGASQAAETAPESAESPVEKAPERGTSRPPLLPEKGDISSRKGDIWFRPHNKDNSPSGNSTGAREGVRALVAAEAADAGAFFLDAEGLLAHAGLGREHRQALWSDLQARLCRISPDGALVIRARDRQDAERLRDRWLERVSAWAVDLGLTGVVIDADWAVMAGEAG